MSERSDIRFKTPHQDRVEKFMVEAKQAVPEEPTLPDEKVRRLRAWLILEEAMETIEALGFFIDVDYDPNSVCVHFDDITLFAHNGQIKLEDVADGCADIIVVTTGTLSACGIADDSVQREVDCNNLAKFGPGHSWDEHGKLIKPSDHKPPRVNEVIEEQTKAAMGSKATVALPITPDPKCLGKNFSLSDDLCRMCAANRRKRCVDKVVATRLSHKDGE